MIITKTPPLLPIRIGGGALFSSVCFSILQYDGTKIHINTMQNDTKRSKRHKWEVQPLDWQPTALDLEVKPLQRPKRKTPPLR